MNIQFLRNCLLFALAQVALLSALLVFYFWSTYQDVTIIEGSGYGFEIGEEKRAVYDKAYISLTTLGDGYTSVFSELKVEAIMAEKIGVQEGVTILAETHLNENRFEEFKNKDTWIFYINASRFNLLKLTFCGDRLCEIHRHQKRFELP